MVRTVLSVTTGLVVLCAAVPSQGADIARPRVYSKPPLYQPAFAPFTWQGFYSTINAGYGWGSSTVTMAGTSTTVDPTGGIIGSGFGYNFQTGSIVFGVEGDADYSRLHDTSGAGAACSNCEVSNRYLATVRGRLGYAWDRWLAYGTGGAAFGDITVSIPASGSQAVNKTGWTAGGGVEYAFAGSNWSTKVEYLYVDLGSATCDASHCATTATADFHAHVARVGMNFRF